MIEVRRIGEPEPDRNVTRELVQSYEWNGEGQLNVLRSPGGPPVPVLATPPTFHLFAGEVYGELLFAAKDVTEITLWRSSGCQGGVIGVTGHLFELTSIAYYDLSGLECLSSKATRVAVEVVLRHVELSAP